MAQEEMMIDLREAPKRAPRDPEPNPLDDAVVWYVDRMFGHAVPGERFFTLVLSLLDGEACRGIAERLEPEGGTFFNWKDPSEFGRELGEWVDAWRARFRSRSPLSTGDAGTPSPVRGVSTDSDPDTLMKALFSAFMAAHAGRALDRPLEAVKNRLRDIFRLNEEELAILCILYVMSCKDELSGFLNSLPASEYYRFLGIALDIEVRKVREILSSESRLLKLGFVYIDFVPPPYFGLGPEMMNFFRDPSSSFQFAQTLKNFIEQNDCARYPLDTYPVPPVSREILKNLVRADRGSILIHGEPGTGKTSFVAALLEEVERPVFVLRLVTAQAEKGPNYIRLQMASYLCANVGGVLVVDEADSILNTDSSKSGEAWVSKAWLTEFMDTHTGPVVWIANDIDGTHDAVLRRFAYSLRFRDQTESQRKRLWRTLVRKYEVEGLIGEGALDRLAREHRVNAGGIAVALKGLRTCIEKAESVVDGIPILSELLTRHECLMNGVETVRASGKPGRDRFLPDAIRTDIPLGNLTAGLRNVASRIRNRMEEAALGVPAEVRDAEGMEAKLLFYGPPGTGKTAFARHLSVELGLPLVQKRASDLFNTFVGQTEKAIAAAFEEAEAEGAILFLDEVDSLFVDRRNARYSWERSQVNELLSRMEDFSGILVCCTNFLEGLDPASLRRFQWKVSFQPPEPRHRLELYRCYFTALAGEPDGEVERRLAGMDGLCPGDIAAAYKAYAPFLGGEPGFAVGHGEILDRLEGEMRARSSGRPRVLGFAS